MTYAQVGDILIMKVTQNQEDLTYNFQIDVGGAVLKPDNSFLTQSEAQFGALQYTRKILNQAIEQISLPILIK